MLPKGSPAEKAGIKRGDIILDYNGRKVDDVGNLRNMVAQSKVGEQVPMTIMRSGKEYAINVMTTELPKDAADTSPGSAPDDSCL